MEKEQHFIKMVIDSKDILKKINKMEKVYFILMKGTDMKEIGKMEKWNIKEFYIMISGINI